MVTQIGLENTSRDDRSVLTLGMFDGVHLGHRTILQRLKEVAGKRNGPTVVITFDPHPQAVLRGTAVPLLTTVEERAEILAAEGIDRMVVLAFTEALADMTAEQFVLDVLVGRIGMGAVVLGHDHGFGRDRQGGEALLERLALVHGFETFAVGPAQAGAGIVSSSRIRTLLQKDGAVREAAALLGRPYALVGTVVEGDRRGRTIGFPTANMQPIHSNKLVPRRGVYAVEAFRLATAENIGGMMNVGVRPTFSSGERTHLEAHLFEFNDILYGETLRVRFVDRIRDETRFPDVKSLITQLERDQVRCKQVLSNL